MHELSVCQALMTEVESLARHHKARRVTSIRVGIGPLSGVEAELLRHAYPVASAGTIADGAALEIESTSVTVRCKTCGETTEARPNRLVCGHCGDWKTVLVSGDELILITVELDRSEAGLTEPIH